MGWWALSDGYPVEIPGKPPTEWPSYPRGALIRYREWYGASGPNKGIKLTNFEIGKGIVSRTPPDETIAYTVCDPSIFAQEGGPSIAEQMWKGGRHERGKFQLRKADNRRIPGWGQMRSRMMGDEAGDHAGRPMIYFFSTCKDAIRTVPVLQHDDKNAEDLDTEGEDHAADEIRYMCQARPIQRKLAPNPGDVPYGHVPSIDEVIAHEQGRARANKDYRGI